MDKAGKIMNLTHMQQRIDTADNWTNDNPVLMEGEIGYELQPETGGKLLPPKEKIGDGKTDWNDLPYRDGNDGGFKSYVTPTVTIDAGGECVFTYPSSEKILTQVYEVSDGGTHDNPNVAFDSADKYKIDVSGATVGDGSVQISGGIDQYTKLLLHCNTNIIDSSLTPHIGTNNGATFDTTNYKFGASSLSFNGSSYLDFGTSNDFSPVSQDFTIGMWIKYGNSISAFTALVSCADPVMGDSTNGFQFAIYNNKIAVELRSTQFFGTRVLNDNLWHYIEFDKKGTSIYAFVDGNIEISSNYSNSIICSNYHLYIGIERQKNNHFNGNIDEIKFDMGIARHTSDFTPPNAEYHTPTVNQPGNVATTDSSNLSLSKVTKINSLAIPATIPTNTSIKILTSFDDRNTWLYHDNSGWHSFGTIGSEWTISNSNTELQTYFTNLSIAQLASDLGYTPTTIDFMFQLETSDSTATPVVSALTMNYTAIGDLECADVGSYDDTCSRYGLKITSPTQLSVKNKDTVSHTISIDIVPLTNITYLN